MTRVEDEEPPTDHVIAKAMAVFAETAEQIAAIIAGAFEAFREATREIAAVLLRQKRVYPAAKTFVSTKYPRAIPPWIPPFAVQKMSSHPIIKHVTPAARRCP